MNVALTALNGRFLSSIRCRIYSQMSKIYFLIFNVILMEWKRRNRTSRVVQHPDNFKFTRQQGSGCKDFLLFNDWIITLQDEQWAVDVQLCLILYFSRFRTLIDGLANNKLEQKTENSASFFYLFNQNWFWFRSDGQHLKSHLIWDCQSFTPLLGGF